MKIFPSTGAFIGRVNGLDHRAFLSVADCLDTDAFEFLMYETFYGREKSVLSDFLAIGCDFPVFHVEKKVGEYIGLGGEDNRREAERRFLVNCRAACALGSEKLVLHLWNGLPSDHAFSRHSEAYAVFAEMARAHGLLLTVENVVCAEADPLSRFAELAALYPDIRFTYDTKMAAHHRQEQLLAPGAARGVLEGRISHIHFNDYGGTPGDFSGLAVLHLGEGHLDIPLLAAGILTLPYDGTVTLECSCMRADGSTVPQKMNASLAIARRLLCGGDAR